MKTRQIHRTLVLLIATLLAMLTAYAQSDEQLIHEASYQGKYKGFTVKMTKGLYSLGENRYRLQSKAKNFLGTIEEIEEFTWQENGDIRPSYYQYNQGLLGSKRSRAIKYNWPDLQAISSDKGEERQITLSPGMLGPMSYQLKLQVDLLQGKEQLEYRFINRGRIKRYHFKKGSQTSIEIKGKLWTELVHLQRSNENGNRKTQLWADKDQHYTLLLLKQQKKKEEHQLFFTAGRYFPSVMNTPLRQYISLSEKPPEPLKK